MNSRLIQKLVATLVASAATGALLMLVHAGTVPLRPLMLLERVVITGKSTTQPVPAQMAQMAQVQQLPRVLIEGRRSDLQLPSQLLAKRQCEQPLVC